ncbi:lysozyme inhibitor LprI family protein [Mesorhizobium sp. CC13]|uniref:lysozyme inhibitor LprI family protein n=1 Tax=Mesorhizobium sp. CC13 TaxID=3029194 RepID=UPI003266193E
MRISGLTLWPIAGLAILAATAAQAADNCANANDQATMNECADKAFRASDAELNTLYRQIQGRLKDDPGAAKLLVAAQRAWVGFRDAECDFSSSGVAQGSIYPMTVLQCHDGMTRQRIKDLQNYLKCDEGDTSCPIPAAK